MYGNAGITHYTYENMYVRRIHGSPIVVKATLEALLRRKATGENDRARTRDPHSFGELQPRY